MSDAIYPLFQAPKAATESAMRDYPFCSECGRLITQTAHVCRNYQSTDGTSYARICVHLPSEKKTGATES
jgi:RNA polymerase subunit RPABC4/transcription elongation factor Spt4